MIIIVHREIVSVGIVVMARFVAIGIIIVTIMCVESVVLAQTAESNVNEGGVNDCEDLRQQLDTVTAVKEAACAEVCAMDELLDESLRERCGCHDDAPMVEDDEGLTPEETAYGGAEDSALRSALCATALADALEWQEDADVVEITDTSLTMVVTEDVVLYTLCHTACSSSCGVEHSVSDVSIYEDELVCDGGERTPVSSFFNVTNEMFWMYEDAMVVNVLGTEDDDGTEMSVKMVVWNPVYDEATSTVRFDARLASGSEDVMDDDESHLSPSPEGDRRRRLQQAYARLGTDTYNNPITNSIDFVYHARVCGVISKPSKPTRGG